jgi:hypothetical protein
MLPLILAGEDFQPRQLVFMVGPVIGAIVAVPLRLLLERVGVGRLSRSLVALLVFFAVVFVWSVYVARKWPLP